MSRIRSIASGNHRTMFLLLAIAAAGLVTAGLLVSPPPRSVPVVDRLSAGADKLDATKLVQEAPSTDAATTPGAVSTKDGAASATESSAGAGSAQGAPEMARAGVADVIAPAPAPVSTLAVPAIDARIVRTGSIELRVRRGSFEDVWSDAQAVARANGGYVQAASRSGADRGPRSGSITLRVPSAKFDAAVDRLRGLDRTKVERLDIASQDVTQEFVDVKSRLRHDRAVEARLLALLADTDGVSEVLAVQARLDQMQEQIELSKGRLDYLDAMTTTSTIELALSEPGGAVRPEKADEPSVLAESFSDARERFTENVGAAVVWLGGALPALVLLAAIGLLARGIMRRRNRIDGPRDTDIA